MYDNKSSWNNNIINSCIESYLRSPICIDSYFLGDSDKNNDSYFSSYICGKGISWSESESSSIITSTNDTNDSDLTIRESSNDLDLDETQKYKHLWVECENCYGLNKKKN
ncbi:putative acetyl-CoA carboxylase [Lupinus albus]|uniref:Putative acetyl-CoA carboxylase n=1 Tax=Lupinus albus TaxID=3870 RepID=A0A6A4NJL0_LUPAL|nr:putative acetyl-CoA carboxylase [Lupinus albus]